MESRKKPDKISSFRHSNSSSNSHHKSGNLNSGFRQQQNNSNHLSRKSDDSRKNEKHSSNNHSSSRRSQSISNNSHQNRINGISSNNDYNSNSHKRNPNSKIHSNRSKSVRNNSHNSYSNRDNNPENDSKKNSQFSQPSYRRNINFKNSSNINDDDHNYKNKSIKSASTKSNDFNIQPRKNDINDISKTVNPKKRITVNDDGFLPKDIAHTQVPPKLRNKHANAVRTIDLTTQEGRKKVADETLQILKTGKYTYANSHGKSEEVDIGSHIFNCKYNTKTYKPEYYEHFTLPQKGSMCKIEVKPESTFGAARRFFAMKIRTCVLNFASATKPGGGFKNGKKAQEESLSRQSALYASLEKQKEMYQVHLANKNDNVYKDYLIYSCSVPVFRDDKIEQLLPKDQVFYTDVITSAAPWKAKIQESGGDISKLDKIITKRCRKIIRCAIDNKVEALVLGAYGCGVFGNKPKDISQIFKKLLIDEEYGKFFKIVDFAITGKTSENFIEFTSTFRPYMSSAH